MSAWGPVNVSVAVQHPARRSTPCRTASRMFRGSGATGVRENVVRFFADIAFLQLGARWIRACRLRKQTAGPLCFLGLLHQLSGSLDITLSPESNLHATDLLQRWRLDPVAISDVALQGH